MHQYYRLARSAHIATNGRERPVRRCVRTANTSHEGNVCIKRIGTVCGLADNALFPAPNRKAALGSPHRTRHFLKQRRLQGYATANATAGYLKVIQAVRKMLRKGIYSLSSALAVGVLKSGQRVNGSAS